MEPIKIDIDRNQLIDGIRDMLKPDPKMNRKQRRARERKIKRAAKPINMEVVRKTARVKDIRKGRK